MKLLEYITMYRKTGKNIIIGYFVVLIMFNLFFHEGSIEEKVFLYITTTLGCIFTYIFFYTFLGVAMKIPLSSKKILEWVLKSMVSVFAVCTIIYGVYYFISGFSRLAFGVPLISIASLKRLEQLEAEI